MPTSDRRATRWAVGVAGMLVAGVAAAAELPPHPRLLLPADGIAAIEARARRDPIVHTAMAWRLTGERVFFERCVKELDAACGLPDWNPAHFLDVAEMATAVAIGCDWLHADLTDDQRDRYRAALVGMAIEPAVRGLEKRAHWTRPVNNWAQVCGAGIAFASACVSEDAEALDATPYHECLRIVVESNRFYEPDGCYPEGPGYCDYGTSYHVGALALAESLGQHVEVPRPLLAGAAFMTHVRGPSGTVFNFADSGPAQDAFIPARGWLVSRSADAALAADLRRNLLARAERFQKQGGNDRFFPLHLLWLPEEPRDPPALPLAAVFGGQQPCLNARSHNVIRIDGGLQNPRATSVAIVVEPAGTVRWQALVDVKPRLEGGLAILELDGRGIALQLDAPSAGWRVESAAPGSPGENPNAGFHLLVAECPRASRVTIEVTIRPRSPVAP